MSDRQFDKAVNDWLESGSDRTPPAAIDAVLLAIKTTPQQRDLRIPRRFIEMTFPMRLAAAIAIVAVLGVGAFTFLVRSPDSGFGGQPTPVPTTSPAPTGTPLVLPSPTPIGALTETFVSTIHGITVSYPTGWVPRPATEPWPAGAFVTEQSVFADVITDGSTNDTAFIAVASRPLGATPFNQWAAAYLAGECSQAEPITVAGAVGVVSTVVDNSACSLALVPAGGRVYLIWLYRIEDRSQFLDVLGTVDLRPQDAVDTAPSATP